MLADAGLHYFLTMDMAFLYSRPASQLCSILLKLVLLARDQNLPSRCVFQKWVIRVRPEYREFTKVGWEAEYITSSLYHCPMVSGKIRALNIIKLLVVD